MNIVYLHAHDAGHVVEPYGFPVRTPHLQNFAREGTLFRNAFAVSPTCGPSRAALTSGQYPHQLGVYGLPGPQGWRFDDYSKHLVNYLGQNGYETVLAGVQHEADHDSHFPEIQYERVLEREAPAREQDGQFYPETIQKVETWMATRRDSRPFFLSVGIDEPHRDNIPRPELNLHGASDRFSKTRYYDPERLDARYTAPPPWLPDLPHIRKDMASYQEGVALMDEYMGRVLYALEHNGLVGNTLVVVTSDHGIEFPGAKKTLQDPGTRVMLMIRGPEGSPFNSGRVIEPLVSHLDLYPTIASLLGKAPAHELQGRSLLPLVHGECETLHEAIYTEQTWHGTLEPLRAVRTPRYKLIRHHFPKGPLLRHDGPTSPIMESVGWYDRECGHEELFDLFLDPTEVCNRASDPAYAAIRSDLADKLDRWMAQTHDPFPSGTFPQPQQEQPRNPPSS